MNQSAPIRINAVHEPRIVPARRGSAYLLVLGATLIVTTMSVGAALVLSSEIAAQAKRAQMAQARISAQSALELSVASFANTTPERKALGQGAAVVAASVGGLRTFAKATAIDGSDISSEPGDPFVLTAYAEGTTASQGVRATVIPRALIVDSFDAAMHAGGSISITSSTVTGGPAIGAGGNVSASASTVALPVYATGLIVGSTYSGTVEASARSRQLPANSGLVYYAERAQPISYDVTNGTIRRCVLGPGVNPYGAASATGTYSIDCGGKNLDIEDCRIVGTLVVWNVSSVRVSKAVNWSPATANAPILVMRGTLDCSLEVGGLTESSTGVNFTPATLPFQGQSNSNQSDTLPNAWKGVVYVDGDVKIDKHYFGLDGALVCTGNLSIDKAKVVLSRATDLAAPAGLVPYELTTSGGLSKVVR